MGTATLQRPPATVTPLGFTWSCRKELCDESGHDRDTTSSTCAATETRHDQREDHRERLPDPAETPPDDPAAVIELDDMRRAAATATGQQTPWPRLDYRRRRLRGTARQAAAPAVRPPSGMTDAGRTECACTVAYEIAPVITEAHRSGRVLGRPGRTRVPSGSCPYEPAPWEDSPARPVRRSRR